MRATYITGEYVKTVWRDNIENNNNYDNDMFNIYRNS